MSLSLAMTSASYHRKGPLRRCYGRWPWCWRCGKYRAAGPSAAFPKWSAYCGHYIGKIYQSDLAGPDIVSRGFVYVRESETLMDDARHVVSNALENCLSHRCSDWGKIKNVVRELSGRFCLEADKA